MKIRIKFAKEGIMKFVGHLDIMRCFQKVMRRADVDIRYSDGFSPHQVMSFAAPLGVGLESRGEYVDIEVLGTDSSEEMVRRLNKAMPEGLEVLSYKRLPDDAANAMSVVAAADYTVRFRKQYEPEDWEGFAAGLTGFMENEHIIVLKKTKKGEKETDIRPMIYALEAGKPETGEAEGGNARAEETKAQPTETMAQPEEIMAQPTKSMAQPEEPAAQHGNRRITMRIATGSAANLKPDAVIRAYMESRGETMAEFALNITRTEVYAGKEEEGKLVLCPLEAFGEDIE